jgi:hypothetical protein
MQGIIVWYDPKKTQGIISVTENGIVQKYFLLLSRIARSPETIKAGQFAKFIAVGPPPKPGLLPVALAVEISETPFAPQTEVRS